MMNSSSPFDKKRIVKTKMAWRILALFFSIFLFLLIFVGDSVGSFYSYLISLSLSILGIAFLYWKKNPDPLFFFGALSGSAVAQISTWTVIGASHYVDFLWIVICSVVAFLGAKRKYAAILLVFNTIGIGIFVYFVQNDHIKYIQTLTTIEQSSNYVEIVLAFFILGYILYEFMGFNQDSEEAYREANLHLQNQNRTIIHQNEQNVVLLKEIHHRVKNNLQIIVSLLRLQKHELASEEAKLQFQEAINRVIVMSSIHEKLYRQGDFSQINLSSHLSELINEVKMLFDTEKDILIDINCELQFIDLKSMLPVGLLINELLSNTFKYAFTNRKEGRIQIEILPSTKGFSLSFEDDGLWNLDNKKGGFGLELIEVFTNQLNGTRRFETDSNGTRYYFDLEYADAEGSK